MITSVGHSRPDKRVDTKLNDNRHGDDWLVIDEIGSKNAEFFYRDLFFVQFEQINRVSFKHFITYKSDKKKISFR